jgi:hypothetical protein
MEQDNESSHSDNGFEKLPSPGDDVSSTPPPVSAGSIEPSGIEELSPPPETSQAPLDKLEDEETHVVGSSGAQKSQQSSSSCPFSGTCCMKNVDPRVVDLVMWRDVKKTAVVFSSLLVGLASLSLFSVLSVAAYFGLVILTISIGLRLYTHVMSMMNKTTDPVTPFKKCLEYDLTITPERVHEFADSAAEHLTKIAENLRRLFLVENVVDSVKFGLILWLLTYVGAWFNGLTLLIMGTIIHFTVPKFYTTYKDQIDHYAHIGCSKVSDIWKKVQEKVPMLAKKKQE